MSKRKFARWCVMAACCLVLALGVSHSAAQQSAADSDNVREKQVREFVAAFNAHQVDKMLALVDEQVQWLIVDGSKINVETEGRQALRASM